MKIAAGVFSIAVLLVTTPAAAQTNPCTAPGTDLVSLSAQGQFRVAFESTDHADAVKVNDYVVRVAAQASPGAVVSQQVFSRTAVTLAPGTTNCYTVDMTRVPALVDNTQYVATVVARSTAIGDSDPTDPTNPFVYPSRARLGRARVGKP